MPNAKFSITLLFSLVLASQLLVIAVTAPNREDVAASSLKDTEKVLASAYQDVLRAEEAGANVSALILRLNDAAGLLAQASTIYRLGDFEEAALLADSSRNIGIEVENNAINLRNSALSEGFQREVFTLTASFIGVALIALGSFWIWHIFKRHHYGNVLKMKPEVSSNEF